MKNSKFITVTVLSFILNFTLLIVNYSSYALDVKREVLENGLVLMTVERHNLPVVRVAVGIDAGSLNEPADKAGLANLVAALLTEGTARRTGRQISEEIEFVGGSVGASGGVDYITASLSVLKKDVDLGFDLLSDIILNPVFPEDEISKKKERIKGGLKASEENPRFIASKNFRKAAARVHEIYGKRPSVPAKKPWTVRRNNCRSCGKPRSWMPGVWEWWLLWVGPWPI